jgi:hypothetical protein
VGLEAWAEAGWIRQHDPDPTEFVELLAVADRALGDAGHSALTPDGRLGLAWPAVLALGSAALASAGYRMGKERHHERVVDSLLYTVGLDQSEVGALHRVRRLRNEMTYERVGTTTAEEAERFVERVRELRVVVLAWLVKRHPELA